MIPRLRSTAVAAAALAMLSGCGTQVSLDANASGGNASPNCSSDVAPIAESSQFTPFDGRLTSLAPPEGLRFLPVTPGARLFGLPEQIGATRPLVGLATNGGPTTVFGYHEESDPPTDRSDFVSTGGVLIAVTRDETGGKVVANSVEDPFTGHRTTVVSIGDFEGALTWADPDEKGVRPHHLIWSDGKNIFNLAVVRDAEETVALARSLVCS